MHMHRAQSHACTPAIALRSLTTARRCSIAAQPYLKYHNPRTFEDLSAPVPNFRSLALKAGDVPKFFDSVLVRRADDAVTQVRPRSSSHEPRNSYGQVAMVRPLHRLAWAQQHTCITGGRSQQQDQLHAWEQQQQAGQEGRGPGQSFWAGDARAHRLLARGARWHEG